MSNKLKETNDRKVLSSLRKQKDIYVRVLRGDNHERRMTDKQSYLSYSRIFSFQSVATVVRGASAHSSKFLHRYARVDGYPTVPTATQQGSECMPATVG